MHHLNLDVMIPHIKHSLKFFPRFSGIERKLIFLSISENHRENLSFQTSHKLHEQ
jgi:hypothetical protein